ncbi:TetR/AcrR family transcriptional regulator [Pyxidicoccus parkwayensis]|jgi:AcrR family transcriptional regulator|uniref:TetR/AcrR family transcriptional regulator n=1 Tax=Pyxidicoccus parkwayensis TaxID=2813578 RepID=A0ABX7P9K3_9BACT|nr:TetR/AcrR family transcriptional regulator [Pyxidicoccus parkwaysis]QSQ27090.1 TetR/AcrR family transcriptional regulator [Pyxidicoccus parkwaysis]
MGRTRSFDEEVALDRAMRLFWKQGYEGTSLEDLTSTLGIAKPSLYAAFGNKRALFTKAVERYIRGVGAELQRALDEPRAEDVVRRFLRIYTEVRTDAPPGCFLVQGALACSPESAEVQHEVAERRQEAEALLAQRLARAQKEGDLPAEARPNDLAKYVCTVAQGLSVQAAGGATTAQLRRVAELALMNWTALAGEKRRPEGRR